MADSPSSAREPAKGFDKRWADAVPVEPWKPRSGQTGEREGEDGPDLDHIQEIIQRAGTAARVSGFKGVRTPPKRLRQ